MEPTETPLVSDRTAAHAGARLLGRSRRLTLLAVVLAGLLASSCAGGGARDGADVSRNRAHDGMVAQQQPAPVESAAKGEAAAPDDEKQAAESYERLDENPFVVAARAPLSTFSIDVDTASYSNTRRFLEGGQLPPRDAVRIEELINYFSYDYPQPTGSAPFSVTAETADCLWNSEHSLVHIGLQGRRIAAEQMPPANLVFLVDVSGSMRPENRLPLVKSSLRMLAEQLSARDRVAVVVYAGTSGLALASTPGDRKGEIISAVERLEAGGSTNGGEGIRLAYRVAEQNFIQGGTNRVLLATDGDFNVGVSSESELVRLIEEKRRGGVFLSVLGYGRGNLKDSTMEKLADHGNGNYAYIDTPAEARKVLGGEVSGTLHTIAKDVKIQVEFNPAVVAGYRLIGYENRVLRERDFNDDRVDAGEIGAGHTVTALYEIVPAGRKVPDASVDELKYQRTTPNDVARGGELLTVKLRYKEPGGEQSRLLSVGVADSRAALDNASADFKFSASVAAFGMLLRDSKHKGGATFDSILQLARASSGPDLQGYRSEFISLVEKARDLSARRRTSD